MRHSKDGCISRLGLVVAVAVALLPVVSGPALAEGAKPAGTPVPPITLTAEEIAEKEGRKACKIQICAAFRLRKPGPEIACSVVKSWRKSQLDKLMSRAKTSWPWGPVRCQSDVRLDRDLLHKAMTEKAFDLALQEHKVACTIEREKEPAKIAFAFTPKVRFENGKAVKASLNWGKIEAPTLVKGALWAATATDNTFNVLDKSVVEDINAFINAQCDEIKSEWAGQ